MRARDFILESSGGILRRAQEVAQGKTVVFSKGEGNDITLDSAVAIPEDALKYESVEELEQGLVDALAALGNPTILYYSKLQKTHRAALITLWTDSAGEKVGFVKFSNAKSPGPLSITWTNSDFTRETGFTQKNNKVAERAQFKLKPNELFTTDVDLNARSLSKQIKSRDDLPEGVAEQLQGLLENVENGVTTPIPGAEQYLTTYEVDFGESAAPIALVTGNFVSGSYQDAEDALLAPLGMKWSNIESVLFPGAGSNLLYDSYLRLNKNTTLKVSSKDKKGGAAASVTGLMKEIETSPERFTEITNDKNYAEILDIVRTVAKFRADDGVLKLAVQFQLIDEKEANEIKSRLGRGEKYAPDAKWARTPGIQAALQRKGAKFQDLAYDFGFHMLAGVAELVADHLNKMANIDQFFKAILERSTMVQVKAKMQKSGNGAAFTNFQVIYPPTFSGNIKVVAGNNYMATRKPIGKLSFKIG